jgi:hypothetical protein
MLKRLGWSLLALGLALGALSAVFVVKDLVGPLADSATNPTYSVPGTDSIQLDKGKYLIYARLESIAPGEVEVKAPDGHELATTTSGTTETLTRDGDAYTGVVAFEVPAKGIYEITIDSTPNEVFVGRDLVDVLLDSLVWIITGGLAVLMVLAAVVLLIVGFTRKPKQPMAVVGAYGAPAYGAPAYGAPAYGAPAYGAPAQVAPGWYLDPYDQSQSRWWDGNSWADATHRPS